MKDHEVHVVLVGHEGSHNRGCEALVRTTINVCQKAFECVRFTLVSEYPEHDYVLQDIEKLHVVPGHSSAPYLYVNTDKSSPISTDFKLKDELDAFSEKRGMSLKKLTKFLMPYGLVHMRRSFIKRRKIETSDVEEVQSHFGGDEQYALVKHLKNLFSSADVIISIGGDLFIEDWGVPEYALQTMEFAQVLGVKTVVWGASIWPIKNPHTETRIFQILRQSELITIRDAPSVQYLQQKGITENVCQVADGAFVMDPVATEKTVLPWGKVEHSVVWGINASPLVEYFLGKQRTQEIVLEIIRYLRWLIDDFAAKIVFVAHDSFPAPRELDFCYEICKAVDRPASTYIPPIGLGARETKDVIRQCDYFIAMRFHASIASLSQSIPTLGLSYSPKFIGLHESVYGHTDLLLPYERISVEQLREKSEFMVMNEDKIEAGLINKNLMLGRQALAGCDHLGALVMTGGA